MKAPGQPKTGGPAFPANSLHESGMTMIHCGMSLRDWFAGQALVGLLANGGTGHEASVATNAHLYADAMLAERAKGGGR